MQYNSVMRVVWGLFLVCLCAMTGAILSARRSAASSVIVFISDRDGNAEVFRVNSDGGDLRQLTYTTLGAYCWASPSPNGQLVYTIYAEASCSKGPHRLGVMRLDGSHPRILQGIETHQLETWSPDGEWAVYTDSQQTLHKISWRTQHSQPLTATSIHHPHPNPVWSPDYQWIAYYDDPDNDFVVDVVLVNPDTGDQQVLSTEGQPINLNVKPVWSSDSRAIFFASASRMLYRLEVESGTLHLVNMRTALSSVQQMQLRLSPDGQWLMYLGECGGKWGLCRVALTEGTPLGEAVVGGVEQSAQFALAPDGQAVVVARRNRQGFIKLYWVDIYSGYDRPLTTGQGDDTLPMWATPISSPWLGWGWLVIGGGLWAVWLWQAVAYALFND